MTNLQNAHSGLYRHRSAAIGLLLSFCFAMGNCFVSNSLHPRFQNRQETIAQQFSILEGELCTKPGPPKYFFEFQNRILFAAVLKVATRFSILSVGQWYLLLRILSAVLAYFAFWWVLTQVVGVSGLLAAAGQLLLSFSMIFTFNHGWEHPTDFIDLLFFSLFVGAALKKQRVLLAVLMLLASCNRESTVLGGVLWLGLYGVSPAKQWRNWKWNGVEILYGLAVSILSYAAVMAWRVGLCGKFKASQALALRYLIPSMVDSLASLNPYAWPIIGTVMFLPAVLWLAANRRFFDDTTRGLLWASFGTALATMVFGLALELRVFIPAVTILTIAAVRAQDRADHKQDC